MKRPKLKREDRLEKLFLLKKHPDLKKRDIKKLKKLAEQNGISIGSLICLAKQMK